MKKDQEKILGRILHDELVYCTIAGQSALAVEADKYMYKNN